MKTSKDINSRLTILMASEDFIDLDQTPNNFLHTSLISTGSPLPEQWLGSVCVGGSRRRPSTHFGSVSKAELNSQHRCICRRWVDGVEKVEAATLPGLLAAFLRPVFAA
jgi:hypothetical protein